MNASHVSACNYVYNKSSGGVCLNFRLQACAGGTVSMITILLYCVKQENNVWEVRLNEKQQRLFIKRSTELQLLLLWLKQLQCEAIFFYYWFKKKSHFSFKRRWRGLSIHLSPEKDILSPRHILMIYVFLEPSQQKAVRIVKWKVCPEADAGWKVIGWLNELRLSLWTPSICTTHFIGNWPVILEKWETDFIDFLQKIMRHSSKETLNEVEKQKG